jgi:ABC-type long-subunit fatty acid transport system fused permease/ATPase subunit
LKDPGFEYPPECNMYAEDTQYGDDDGDDLERNTTEKLSKLVKGNFFSLYLFEISL